MKRSDRKASRSWAVNDFTDSNPALRRHRRGVNALVYRNLVHARWACACALREWEVAVVRGQPWTAEANEAWTTYKKFDLEVSRLAAALDRRRRAIYSCR
jgi:hypothetical protein